MKEFMLRHLVSIYHVIAAFFTIAIATAFSASAAETAGQTAIDFTQVLIAIVGGIFSIIATVLAVAIPVVVNKYVKDKQAAVVVTNAIKNSLGKIQQVGQAYAEGQIRELHPELNVPDYLAPGVQYVLDHAGTEAERFGLTPEAIADKIIAQLGLKNIETNLAITQSAAPVSAGPMAAVRQAEVKMADTGPVSPESPSSEGGDTKG